MDSYLGLFHFQPIRNEIQNDFITSHSRQTVSESFHFFSPQKTSQSATSTYFCFIYGVINNLNELKAGCNHSDHDYIYQSYKTQGNSFFAKLSGAWICIIYDKIQKELIIARDHLGQKPLFYTQTDSLFAFSYDLKQLVDLPTIKATISPLSLQKFFVYSSVPAPLTLYKEINALPPATVLHLNEEKRKTKFSKYWNYQISRESNQVQIKKLNEEFVEIFRNSIKQQLSKASKPSTAISGGIDSTATLAFAHNEFPNDFLTFSINFEEDSFDEETYIRIARNKFKTKHESFVLTDQALKENLSVIKKALPITMGDASFIPCYFLNQLVKEKTDLMLTGDGADELFCGYDPFHATSTANVLYHILPNLFWQAARRLSHRLPSNFKNISFDFKIKQFLNGMDQERKYWPALWMSSLRQDDFKDVFLSNSRNEELLSEMDELFIESEGHLLSFIQLYFLKIYFPNVVQMKAERASRYHGVNSFSPFLDLEMINFSAQVPIQFKYNQEITKYFMKESLKGLIPQEIIHRKKKGFGSPIAHWLKNETIALDVKKNLHFMNNDFINTAKAKHKKGIENHHQFLWNCFVLEK